MWTRGARPLGAAAAALAVPAASRRRGGVQAEVTELAAPGTAAVPAPGTWHRGYRWFNAESPSSPAGAAATPEVWASGLRGPRWPGPAPRSGERLFRRGEVQACDGSGPDGVILVTYRDGVYDVTGYVKEHPGRHFILRAAGGPIDSWWNYWATHHTSPEAAAALERLRVGRLHEEDAALEPDVERTGGGVWADEQELESRATNRRTCWRMGEMPYESATHSAVLAQGYLTDRDALYVRNHAPVPAVAPEDAPGHELTISVGDQELASLSLGELRARFPVCHVTSVLQCAGNRAAHGIAELGAEGSGFTGQDSEYIGLGMLGNAVWGGLRLASVLRELVPDAVRAEWCSRDLHVSFEGLDGYYTSVPLALVMDETRDCLLATEVNGQELSPDHGYPVRVFLPGVAGARSVKWVTKISVGERSDSPWTCRFYLDKPAMTQIVDLPLNSGILWPEPGTAISAGETTLAVRGVAYGGGSGREVDRVELSADWGQTWHQARLLKEEIQRADARGPYRGWVRFEAALPLAPAQGLGCGGPLQEVWCRARGDDGAWQPRRSAQHGGYLYNGYHRVPIVRS